MNIEAETNWAVGPGSEDDPLGGALRHAIGRCRADRLPRRVKALLDRLDSRQGDDAAVAEPSNPDEQTTSA